ncbi:MAG: hypothetical protein E6I69_06200 [Chloroflexi bacterium]|nr:MAG: hypothetical protein E6I69_06200 [Chloroflexota bacterium]TME91300.1 MAG: hypothetical protein E6I34_11245 [Chloroflexota bacterium]
MELMYPGGGGGGFGAQWVELNHLDRILAQLTRPQLAGSGVPPAVEDDLESIGLSAYRTGRKELVQRVWGRKRPLLRSLEPDDDPIPPCA